MGLCRTRILFVCNLTCLESNVFSSGMREPLNAVSKDEKPASLQVVGAERPRNVLSVPTQEGLPLLGSQKYYAGPL